jgi:tetratricopeptide (TPR) repeat protein
MAERIEEPEAEAPEATSPGPEGVAAAMTAALRRRKRGDKADPEFDAFLRKQSRLIDLQTEHLHEQRELILSRLRWGRLSDRLRVLLQAFTILVGVAVAGAVGLMAWQAHGDHGVSIAAFTAPPDLAARGLTGQVMASKVLDRLSRMQAETNTIRPAASYANDWAGDVKVEIPETGVSLGELNRALRQWLGRETHITGELVRTPAGLELTARADSEPGATFAGQDADLDGLIQKAAESVYAQTQPYRWAAWLQTHGKPEQAQAEFARLALSGSKEDRPWAYVAWAVDLVHQGDVAAAADKARAAIKLDPRLPGAYTELSEAEDSLGHTEAAVDASRKALALVAPGDPSYAQSRFAFLGFIHDLPGALEAGGGIDDLTSRAEAGPIQGVDRRVAVLLQMHDISGAQRVLDQGHGQMPSFAFRTISDVLTLDDWPGAAAALRDPLSGAGPTRLRVLSGLAVATARTGHVGEGEAMVAPTPLDCYYCLDARAQIAWVQRDWGGADRWFAEAVRQAPSGPDALDDWGQSLLDRGDPQGAMSKFEQAHHAAPHFADPLELWGQALMRKGDFASAAAKFAEADQYAPRWGRNHMLWGEALMLSGHYVEARRQYEAANGLDLSKPDRAALNVLLVRTSTGPLRG